MESTGKDYNIIFRKVVWSNFSRLKSSPRWCIWDSVVVRELDWAQNSLIILVEDRPDETRVSDRMSPSANS